MSAIFEVSNPAAAPGAPLAPVGAVLGRAAEELAHLAGQLESLENLLGALFVEAASADPDFLRQVQGFDHVGQKVSGLAEFLAALAAGVPAEWKVDPAAAAAVVTLADLSARLGLAPDNGRRSADYGECELF